MWRESAPKKKLISLLSNLKLKTPFVFGSQGFFKEKI